MVKSILILHALYNGKTYDGNHIRRQGIPI
jgi:hypothetical protein